MQKGEGYRELLLGAGYRPHKKQVNVEGRPRNWQNVTSLDNNLDTEPDVLWDLTQHPLPFDDNQFNEVHAYDVLEHLAGQGDCGFFFAEFTEYHRVLKPGGVFCATVPTFGPWFYVDPGHRRVITAETLGFLNQEEYKKGVGKTKMSDYRAIYKADLRLIYADAEACDGKTLVFVLEAMGDNGC